MIKLITIPTRPGTNENAHHSPAVARHIGLDVRLDVPRGTLVRVARVTHGAVKSVAWARDPRRLEAGAKMRKNALEFGVLGCFPPSAFYTARCSQPQIHCFEGGARCVSRYCFDSKKAESHDFCNCPALKHRYSDFDTYAS